MLDIAHLQCVPRHMINALEEGGVQSCMGPGDWTHIGPSMHNFMSSKKVKSMIFHV
jgi:hypothetical protein